MKLTNFSDCTVGVDWKWRTGNRKKEENFDRKMQDH